MSFRSVKYSATARDSRGNLAEFGPALLLLFVVILVPILALIRLASATAVMSYVLARCAAAAAVAPTYELALADSKRVAGQLSHSSLWLLSGLKPGAIVRLELYIDEQVIATGQKNVIGPNEPFRKPIAASVNTYQYEVRAAYSMEPLFPQDPVPWLSRIPLLSEPGILTATATRTVEYPDGLTAPQRR